MESDTDASGGAQDLYSCYVRYIEAVNASYEREGSRIRAHIDSLGEFERKMARRDPRVRDQFEEKYRRGYEETVAANRAEIRSRVFGGEG